MHSIHRVAFIVLGLTAFAAWPEPRDRPEFQQEYWAQFDRRDWSAAVAAAEKLVTAARENAAQQPLELAEALSLLGNAYLGAANYVSAEAAYGEALQLVEKSSGAMSADLLDPLRGLGYTFAASGRHAEAVPMLDRALIVSHRNYGLFDVGQQGVLRQLAASLTKLGRAAEAERHMNYMLRVGQQTHGAKDPKLAPVIGLVAEWYADTGNFASARELYRDALDIVARKLGRSNLAMVEPLRGLARTYTQELFYSTLGLRTGRERTPTSADGVSNEYKALNPRYLDSDGEKALERALKIIEAQPNPPGEVHIETLVQLGDWQQIKHHPERALPFYRRAAALQLKLIAAQTDDRSAKKDEQRTLLGFPVRLYYPIPWLAARNVSLPAEDVDEAFVQVEFTVNGNGDVVDPRVVEENGTSRQVSETIDAIRAARYRPRFANGEPVDTPGITHREVFKSRKQVQAERGS
ncbi:MAG: tetratricopeptide repeat protein [Steroidobacter sp.]